MHKNIFFLHVELWSNNLWKTKLGWMGIVVQYKNKKSNNYYSMVHCISPKELNGCTAPPIIWNCTPWVLKWLIYPYLSYSIFFSSSYASRVCKFVNRIPFFTYFRFEIVEFSIQINIPKYTIYNIKLYTLKYKNIMQLNWNWKP